MHEPVARILLLGGDLAEYCQLGEMLSSAQESRYQLLWCEQLESGLSEVVSGNYDVILLDCQLRPDIALTLLQTAIDHGCKLPIIAITDTIQSPVARRAIDTGALDFLAIENLDSYILSRCMAYAVDKREVDKKIAELGLYDPLTGIPNRLLFFQSMAESIEEAKAEQRTLALLLINLDGFKRVNESYGTEAGDQMVATMAQRLSSCVRKSDNVARVGGDEFTLVLDDCSGQDDVTLVAKKVIDVMSVPFTVDGQPLVISCSIGIAIYPEAGNNVDGLLKRANMALTEAKTQRGSQYKFYSEDTSAEAIFRINMEADMRRAIRNNEFEMYYQPRVNLESGDTVGMEALIRWRHPQRGLVPPDEFIPIAEESGLIMPIGYWVIQQACIDIASLDAGGKVGLDVAVNLSFKQLQDSMFVDTATRIIKQSGIDAHRLEFELTETAIMSNYQQTYEGMMALSKLGISFSLDDFGTGFSSFAHIQRLPISALKVDRSFIRNVVNDDDDAIIVKAIINLARSLGLQIIAEGVETLEQVQFLWQNNCDQVQGYYFSPAVPKDEFSRMLERRSTAVR
jgi:diguanylate cyclase (GGDEF)-like protein